MAKSEKEEVIFEFKVEQGDALTEAAELKKLIVQTKDEQKKLNDAFKKGAITMDEYVQEGVRLEANLKRHQSAYNNVQKSVTGVKTQLDKLIDSNKKISQSFKDTAESINVAGVSLNTFKNPAAAAVAGAGLLFAAYSKSARGAEDLRRAQDLLNASTTVFSNKLFGGQGGQFGANSILTFLQKNPLTGVAATTIKQLFSTELEEIDRVADAMKKLREIDLLQLKEAQKLFKENLRDAELNTRFSEDETKSLKARLDAANDIEGSINAAESALLKVQNDRLAAAEKLNEAAKNSIESQALVKDIEREIADIQEDAEGKRSAARNKILALEKLITEEHRKQSDITGGRKLQIIPGQEDATSREGNQETSDSIIEATKQMGGVLIETHAATEAEITAINTKATADRLALIELETNAKLQSVSMISGAVAGFFKEGSELQKTFALISIATDTAEAIAALTASSEQNPANGFTFGAAGIIQFSAGLARILGNIAMAKDILGGAAAGGGNFLTKGPTMLMVGDNPGGVERVTVEPISGKGQTKVWGSNLMAFGGGGSVTTSGDGGLFVNSSTMETNQNLLMANAMKMMPPPEVSVKEVTKVQNRIRVKESRAKIKGRAT
jgi:hypothetical protein